MTDFVIKYWIQVVFSIFISVISLVTKKMYEQMKSEKTEKENIKDGVLALLHYRLYRQCERFIHEGEIDMDDLTNLKYLHKAYSKLGGNGIGTELFNRCKALPIKR